ncbi:MAG: hemolysin family protein [bacterium]
MSYFVILIISLLLFAFFSGMEIAFVSANRLMVELERKKGRLPARVISYFNRKPDYFISTMLIGNNIALVIYGIEMAIILEPLVLRFTSSEIIILVIQVIVSTLLILFTAEFLPKMLFRINPNGFLNVFSIPMLVFYVLLYPITITIIGISNFLLKYVGRVKTLKGSRKNAFSKVDLAHLIKESQTAREHENEEESEMKILQNALDFSKVKLRDCMVPRTDIVAVEENTSIDILRMKFIESGYSKIIVYKENIDNIIGYVSSKDLFENPGSIQSALVRPVIVPETMPANKLLRKLMHEHKSLAVVVDEFGGTSGMITIEDLIEEIIGEIEDEHDVSEFVERKINENEFIFSARLEIAYLNEKYNLDIPESDDYDTLAGFILYYNENFPKANQLLTINSFVVKILKIENTRIDLVNIKRVVTRHI